MTAPYPGRCVCGAVHYRVTQEPLTVYACHCTDCQKRSGSAFGLSMWVRRADLEVTKGTPEMLEVPGVDGQPRHHYICAKCACRLWSSRPSRPEFAVVRPGTLEDTSWLRPAVHVWTRSAQPWFVFPEGVPRMETQPADPRDLIAFGRK